MAESIRMLVVDDYYGSGEFERTLKRRFNNLDIDWVVTNEDALDVIKKGGYDIVIYDLSMEPRLNNPITHKIKDQSPGCILIAKSCADDYIPNGGLPEHFDGKIDYLRFPTNRDYIKEFFESYGLCLEFREDNGQQE